jgi:hypothetical protein
MCKTNVVSFGGGKGCSGRSECWARFVAKEETILKRREKVKNFG